jgi:hypothetical protein
MANLTAGAQQKALDAELQKTLERAEQLVKTLKKTQANREEARSRADEIAAKTKQVEEAAQRARANPSTENLALFKRRKMELKTITPEPETEEPEQESKPRTMCRIDMVPFVNGACPVNKAHTVGHDPYASLHGEDRKKVAMPSWWEGR